MSLFGVLRPVPAIRFKKPIFTIFTLHITMVSANGTDKQNNQIVTIAARTTHGLINLAIFFLVNRTLIGLTL